MKKNKEKERLLVELQENPKAYLFASEKLQNDPDIIKAAKEALDQKEENEKIDGWAKIKTEDGLAYYNPKTGEIVPEANN